jgi:hypothetical protein
MVVNQRGDTCALFRSQRRRGGENLSDKCGDFRFSQIGFDFRVVAFWVIALGCGEPTTGGCDVRVDVPVAGELTHYISVASMSCSSNDVGAQSVPSRHSCHDSVSTALQQFSILQLLVVARKMCVERRRTTP